MVGGVAGDALVLGAAELDPLSVVEVGDVSPWGVPHAVPLVRRDRRLGVPLLELHGVAPGLRGGIDELFGQGHVAVVVDADLGHDVGGVALPHRPVPDPNLARHPSSFRPLTNRSHSSRTAPSPPGRRSTSRAARFTSMWASDTATGHPTSCIASRSFTSFPT